MVSDVSTVWVQGHIFDRDLPSVTRGRRGGGNQPVLQPQLFTASISYIGAVRGSDHAHHAGPHRHRQSQAAC